MNRSSAPRLTVNLSELITRYLNMYALAASAVGVGILGMVQPAEGKVIYTKTNCLLGGDRGSSCLIDLAHDGVNEFAASYSNVRGAAHLWARQYNTHSGGDLIAAKSYAFECFPDWATAIRQGKSIGPKRSWGCRSNENLMEIHGATSGGGYLSGGYWKNVTNRYLGLQFILKGKTHYGWARFNAKISEDGKMAAKLTGYAYETIPNKPIIAGKTKGPDVIAIPGTLGNLAMGRK